MHQLLRKAGSLTVHNHGGHQRSKDDGQPTRYLIRKGGSRTYTYPLTDFGKPVPAYFAFDHDHKMNVTARNNWRGLQGMFLVTDPKNAGFDCPAEGSTFRSTSPTVTSQRTTSSRILSPQPAKVCTTG